MEVNPKKTKRNKTNTSDSCKLVYLKLHESENAIFSPLSQTCYFQEEHLISLGRSNHHTNDKCPFLQIGIDII